MASLVLGAAGAVVGSFFGPLGTSIGWAVGSALGANLFQKGQSGPRLTDLKLQGSAYGSMIPFEFATVRIAGQVIWQTELKEHKQKTGGKGGPTVTTYTYSASFAILLCEGPIGGVLRIWADSRLVFDPATMDPSAFPYVLYLGDEAQLPDPTIEAAEGVGNVPAQRGEAYAVFTDFFLTDYANRIPNFTFEVFSNGAPIPWRYSSFAPFNNAARAGYGGQGPQSGALNADGNLVLSFFDGSSSGNLLSVPITFEINTYDLQGNLISNDLSVVVPPPPEAGGTHFKMVQCSNNPHITWGVGSNAGEELNAFYYDGTITATPILDPSGSTNPNDIEAAIDNMPVYANGAVYCTGGLGPAFVSKWNAPGGAVLNGLPILHYTLTGTQSASHWSLAADDAGNIWVAVDAVAGSSDALFYLDADLNFIHSWTDVQIPAHFKGSFPFTVWNNLLCFHSFDERLIYAYIIDPVAFTFTLAYTGSVEAVPATQNTISLGNGLVLTTDGIVSLQPRAQAVTLASIVSAISVRAGLQTTEIDVSQLTDLVDGYVVSSQGPARGMVEPLQIAYFFDAVESDTVAKFVKRGAAPAVTIATADLGAFASGSTPPPLATVMRTQEVDLPQSISAVYINVNADYQNGEQHSQRQVTQSEMHVSLQLPIVMDDAKAKQVTSVNLYDTWMGRDKVTVLTPRKYVYLEPTDVIVANGYTMRLIDKAETVPGVIKLDGVPTGQFVYNDAAVAGAGLAPPPTPPSGHVPTNLLMLDLPLVTDGDNTYGYYAAMNGSSSATWPGATLFKSIDGGVNYDSLLVDVVPDIIGSATSALGNFGGSNTFDEINSVDVQLNSGSGALSSVSLLEVLNGANEFLLGNEIAQFRTAVLTAPGAYTLSGLLRGRRGTEWAIPSHTAAGDRFVILPTSVNVNGPAGEIFVPRDFKAVTSGATLASATDVPFTNNGVALRTYSPTDIGGGLNAAGDLAITWTRRTRIGGAWQNFVDVPLSEATEAYVVQIWNSTFSLCARVITGITSATVTYTSAQQVTDFGAQQKTIFVTVGQIGMLGLGIQQGAALQGAGSTVDAPISPVPPYGSGPPAPPPSGGCVGTVFNTTLTFALGDPGRTVAPGGFIPGTNWVLKLTTPSSGDYVGALDFFEYASPSGVKRCTLSTSACGAPLIPNAFQEGIHTEVLFAVGRPFYPSLYAHLEYSTDYYFSLNSDVGGGAIEMTIAAN
jgi:hypothetical protein